MARHAYREYIVHRGLNKSCFVSAATRSELQLKKQMKMEAWNAQWERKLEQERKREERAQAQRNVEQSQRIAEKRTKAAEGIQEELDTILLRSIRTAELTFDELRDDAVFDEPEPKSPTLFGMPVEPRFEDEKYHPSIPFLISISSKKRAAFEEKQRLLFENDYQDWVREAHRIEEANNESRAEYNKSLEEWERKREAFEAEQRRNNEEIDALKNGFENGDPASVMQFYDLAISAISVPIRFDEDVAIGYDPEARNLVVDYFFPSIEQLPNLKSVSYVKSRNDFKESYQSATFMKRKYESVVYQLVMRIVKCVSAIDKRSHNIDSVVVNGRVHSVDKATGQTIEPCILSVSTSLEDFRKINLFAVDPKAWFKSTKGISAASIANVTPVAPIVVLDREDKRFIEGYGVEETLDETVNLAAMDWQDFENLIRELFEEEFSGPGGEVKITQASRDGGVDAVAFDPDPIRGGKIVIQAKRYTNTVGVSAVRDLYGTVMNEGAMKGILVTTSDFGNDAYEFASGKPLTLMNGGHLLYLLEQHGHKARIDLKEAKQALKE